MKLKNKISGEIKEFSLFDGNVLQGGATLESLTEEWEDYEEPKGMKDVYVSGFCKNGVMIEFETKEEAEEAVEKLKAWKRLRDKGFRFEGWDNTDRSTVHNFSLFVAIEDLESINKDLDLLFGGEE